MLIITQGDTAIFNLTAKSGDNTLVDLTGAVFTSYILGPLGVVKSFANSQHVANPDQINNRGQFTLTLSVTDTAALAIGEHKEVITKIVIGASTIYFHGVNILTVLPNIPEQ